ncbi:hypothetical protein CFB89_28445 [Burkholderia sp. AU16741]|uniref:hypothetical protein n=1 Tax=Burkholderia sp. AU16741 TaxID=2015347 RepID=UPI000B79F328|nr:hypothetical protein [Burkholderia sp. AU16741]OXI29424.1 hypothetical protein CFB89_28445 [Burkholderia sp. AU16741]
MVGHRGQSRFRRSWAGVLRGREVLDDIPWRTFAHDADLHGTNRCRGSGLIPAADRDHVETVRTPIDANVNVDHGGEVRYRAEKFDRGIGRITDGFNGISGDRLTWLLVWATSSR